MARQSDETKARCEAFLRYLAESGNVSAAVAAAGATFGMVYGRRRRDPLFAQSWADAIAGWRTDAIRERTGGRPAGAQTFRQGQVPCTEEIQEAFLDHLAATCDIAGSARAVGMAPLTMHKLRRTDPAFRAACGEALEAGLDALRLRLAAHAMRAPDAHEEGDAEPVDVDLALRLLQFHDGARRPGARQQVATPEQTDASILKKLRAMGLQHAIRVKA